MVIKIYDFKEKWLSFSKSGRLSNTDFWCVILGFIFLNELVTPKILIALCAVVLGIYFVKKAGDKKIQSI